MVNAVTATEEANQWLADTRQPRILHAFDNVCNLINEHGDVLSIVSAGIGNGPFNLVLETAKAGFEDIDENSKIEIRDGTITIGNYKIQFAYTKTWNPRPDWAFLHKTRYKIAGQIALLDAPVNPSVIGQNAGAFSHAIAQGDAAISIDIARKLAGLGQGLTPSGDDFIMGAIHAAWIIHPAENATKLTKDIADTAGALTTSLSRALLKAAGRGHTGSLWHQFFNALAAEKRENVMYARDKILAVGETSGSDALAGFIGVFDEWK